MFKASSCTLLPSPLLDLIQTPVVSIIVHVNCQDFSNSANLMKFMLLLILECSFKTFLTENQLQFLQGQIPLTSPSWLCLQMLISLAGACWV